MTEKESTQSAETDTPVVDYAFWEAPGTAFKVVYSLQLFHEIDFAVNEGYRKIPHGGIEVGGLLFGTVDEESIRIEAFRPIDCEHASGPSLNLSERDLAEVEKQITAAGSDGELDSFQPVGWFLAHTRGPLEMTDAELKQFERFFPQPCRVTVLVKPERFQPTRFGFLVRKADGEMPREATNSAVILPLPGRSHRPGQLVASIPAPAPTNTAKRAAQNPLPGAPKHAARKKFADDFEDEEVEPASPLSIWKIPPGADETESEAEEIDEEAIPEPAVDPRTAEERAARRQLGRDRARVMEEAFTQNAVAPFRPPALPSLPANVTRPMPDMYDRGGDVLTGYPQPNYALDRFRPMAGPPAPVLTAKSMTALAMAALLGCLVGYLAYLQLPAPVIPLDVRAMNQTIVVSWPPDETRNSIYAAIRFNDGAPVPLSAEERNAGQVSLAAAKDFKVEVMARNWIRDSRGIVRFMHSTAPP